MSITGSGELAFREAVLQSWVTLTQDRYKQVPSSIKWQVKLHNFLDSSKPLLEDEENKEQQQKYSMRLNVCQKLFQWLYTY